MRHAPRIAVPTIALLASFGVARGSDAATDSPIHIYWSAEPVMPGEAVML
jgi:hypothetical protein